MGSLVANLITHSLTRHARAKGSLTAGQHVAQYAWHASTKHQVPIIVVKQVEYHDCRHVLLPIVAASRDAEVPLGRQSMVINFMQRTCIAHAARHKKVDKPQKPLWIANSIAVGSCFAQASHILRCRLSQHVTQTLKLCAPQFASLAKQPYG